MSTKTTKVFRRKNVRRKGARTISLVVTPKTFVRNEDGTAEIEVVLVTERPVLRQDGIIINNKFYPEFYEVLRMKGINTERINGKRGIPFLNAHQTGSLDDILGRSIPGSLSVGTKEATIKFRLGVRCGRAGYTDDIENGTIADTSVGYSIRDFEFEVPEEGIPTMFVNDFTIHENSGVPVPADPDAVIRSQDSRKGTNMKRKNGKVATRGKRDDDQMSDTARDEDLDQDQRDDDTDADQRDDDTDGDEREDGADYEDENDGERKRKRKARKARDDDSSDDEDRDEDEDDSDYDDEDEDSERADGDDEDLRDDDADTDEDKQEKARARKLLADIRARKAKRSSQLVVLDPKRSKAVRQLMEDARSVGVFRQVDVMRRTGMSLDDLKRAMAKAYLSVGHRQAANPIRSRPDASARRSAEDGPEMQAQQRMPTDAELQAGIRKRKNALRR